MTRLARVRAAAAIASDRSDLWTAAALAELVTFGWLPLVAAVVPLPRLSDLAFASAELAGRERAVVLGVAVAVAVLGGVLLTRLVAALADGFVIRVLRHGGRRRGRRARDFDLAAAWGLQVIAFVPLAIALGLLVYTVAIVGPAEWLSPDRSGVDFTGRLLLAVAPALVAVALSGLLTTAFGAVGMQRVIRRRESLRAAARGTVADIRRHAVGVMAIALGGSLARIVVLGVSFVLLETMWRPIASELAGGRLIGVPGLPLLLGFVFVWLCLLIGSGALRTALTILWAAELSDAVPTRDTSEERGSTWTQRPSSS